jgi:outer membrane protein TolC
MKLRFSRAKSAALVTALFVAGVPQTSPAQDPVRVGFVLDGPGRFDQGWHIIREEILRLTEGEFDVQFPEDKTIIADWDSQKIRAAISRLLADEDVDVVITVGLLSSNDICKRGELPKPAIAPYVINPGLQNIPYENGVSGVKNLSYVRFPHDYRRDFEAFHEIFAFEHLGIIADRLNIETVKALSETVSSIVSDEGFALSVIPAEDRAQPVLDAIPEEVDAVYLAPLLRFTDAEFDSLVHRLIERKLPSFSLLGRTDVARGVLAGIAPGEDPDRLARRVAVNLQRILLGEEPGALPVTLDAAESPSINMATARAIGVYPSWAFITVAEVLNAQRTEVINEWSLYTAVQEAIVANLDLATAVREAAARSQEVKGARSILLPQLGLSTDAILSEPAWANLSISGHIHQASIQSREQVRLDISFGAAATYLEILRAKTLEGIQKENLRRARENLSLAQVRVDVGFASPAEVYRWETSIANSRQAVINANARRNVAEISLNRILNQPIEEPFRTRETGLEDTTLITSDRRFLSFFDNQLIFRAFRDFMVQAGLAASPELKELDELIAAQNRFLSSNKRAFWVPQIGLRGDISTILDEGGVGTREGAGEILPGFPLPDDTSWFLGLSASLPLFTSGGRAADVGAAREELYGLEIQKTAVANTVEDRVRSALHLAGASFAGIGLAEDAAEASGKNFALVTDSYTRGIVSIVDLLDAQNAALVARENAANSVFNFLIDLMSVERATGQFYFFLSPEEREGWFGRAENFVEEQIGIR